METTEGKRPRRCAGAEAHPGGMNARRSRPPSKASAGIPLLHADEQRGGEGEGWEFTASIPTWSLHRYDDNLNIAACLGLRR